MGIADPVRVIYDERRETWRLVQGRETFYDEDRYLLQWESREEAIAWARDQGLPLQMEDEHDRDTDTAGDREPDDPGLQSNQIPLWRGDR